jgi:hypothetical protein
MDGLSFMGVFCLKRKPILATRTENHHLFGGEMTLKVTPWTVRIG